MNSVSSLLPPCLYGTDDTGKPNNLLKKKINGDDWDDQGGYSFKGTLDFQTETICDALDAPLDNDKYLIGAHCITLTDTLLGLNSQLVCSKTVCKIFERQSDLR